MTMDKDFIILMLMARYSISYMESKALVHKIMIKDKLQDFYDFLATFPSYEEVINYDEL